MADKSDSDIDMSFAGGLKRIRERHFARRHDKLAALSDEEFAARIADLDRRIVEAEAEFARKKAQRLGYRREAVRLAKENRHKGAVPRSSSAPRSNP